MTNRLQEYMEQTGKTQGQLAAEMRVTREQVCRVANGKPPSPRFILRFWRATDTDTVSAVFSEHVSKYGDAQQ